MDPFIAFLNIIAIIFLVGLNGFFVASEFSIVKMRPSRLDTLLKEGNSRAPAAKIVTEHLDAYLSVTQLGITIASLGLGWIGEPAVAKMLQPAFALFKFPPALQHSVSLVVGFCIITALHIVCGELVPKSLSIQKTESIVLFVAKPLIFFDRLMYPAVWFLNHVANWIVARLGVEAVGEAEEAHNEEEIRILMEESHKQGYIDKTELTYLDNVFDFADRRANDVMVPRTDMICLYVEDPLEESINVALKEEMTRYPICEEDKDHIIGFLHIKDLLKVLHAGERPDLRSLAREVLVVPETLPLSKLLHLLQRRRSQLAILIDEYGGTAGMITLEDILEEIVGDIQDEFDKERPEVEDLGNNAYSLDGKLLLEDVNALFRLELDTDNCDTIGGWVSTHCDYPPKAGQRVETEGAVFEVSEVDKARITRVKVVPAKAEEEVQRAVQEEYGQG